MLGSTSNATSQIILTESPVSVETKITDEREYAEALL